MNEDRIKRIEKAVTELTGALYALRAEHLALLRIVEEYAGLILPKSAADALMRSYAQKRDVELERMILLLGDTQPGLSEQLQKMIDEAKRRTGGI